MKGKKKLHKTCMQCAAYLIENEGYTEEKATDAVMYLLKECFDKGSYEVGGVEMVIATLKMTFMNESVGDASKELLKKLLK